MRRRIELWMASPVRRRFYGWLDWWAFCGMLVRYERQYGTKIQVLEDVDEVEMGEEAGWLMQKLDEQVEVYRPRWQVILAGLVLWFILALALVAGWKAVTH